MKYIIDHDYHIHSHLSSCSNDPLQTNEAILAYARENNFSSVALTNHLWDAAVPGASPWYEPQNVPHLQSALPLPQDPACRFYFGCESDMDKNETIGLSPENYDKFEFIIIPINHFHMTGFTLDKSVSLPEQRADVFVSHFKALLASNLPFHKVGIAHLTCPLLAGCEKKISDLLKIIGAIDDQTWGDLFTQSAKKGIGIELNIDPTCFTDDEKPMHYRPYRIARECGCKFYLGSDAHHPQNLAEAPERFSQIIADLALEEKDKYHFS